MSMPTVRSGGTRKNAERAVNALAGRGHVTLGLESNRYEEDF
jgi:hypothetical protein